MTVSQAARPMKTAEYRFPTVYDGLRGCGS
jgi:hypothetical protein